MMSTDPRHIQIADYDYPLPDERIAKFPLAQRDSSKLLLYRHGQVTHTTFCHLPQLLPQGELLVMNNTRVIQARLHFRKETGAQIEVFCLEPAAPADYALMFQQTRSCTWYCLVGNLKKWKEGALQRTLTVEGKTLSLSASVADAHAKPNALAITFAWDDDKITWAQVLDACGELPIPPYLNRETQESDLTTYQTVYSKVKGSVAAPTAGLHFTPEVLAALDSRGIERAELTLHVGAGTFKPVKSKEIANHEMHSEWIYVPRSVITTLLRHDGHCTAVGTTSVRTLESLYYIGVRLAHDPSLTEEQLAITQWEPYDTCPTLSPAEALHHILAWLDANHLQALHTATQIIIAPGYTYHIVRRIITNFHQPKSTLLLLVSAFVGDDHWRPIYDYALAHNFRFLSYGDSSLLEP